MVTWGLKSWSVEVGQGGKGDGQMRSFIIIVMPYFSLWNLTPVWTQGAIKMQSYPTLALAKRFTLFY